MERYITRLAAAYARGALSQNNKNSLVQDEPQSWIREGEKSGLKMYHFKTKEPLPRVKTVISMLKGLQPESLLDIGSGRGAFLFPFLEEFPWVPVTSLDLLPHRVEMLQCLSKGGIQTLEAMQQDICVWDKPAHSFDIVTMLEVLEHIPDVQAAISAAVRLAKRYVIVSVPSKPDDNPEHIHLLTKDALTVLFHQANCTNLHFSGVNGHTILLASVSTDETEE